MRRLFVRIISGGLLVAVLAGGGVYFWLRSSLPQTDGTIALNGLKAPVQIYRDIYHIPTIFADNEEDALFSLGFVHAQDRLWQMDLLRRLARGNLAEVLGEAALPSDRWFRVLGFGALADQEYETQLPKRLHYLLQRYTDGVNAYLESHQGAWPMEFYLLGYKPTPWRPQDCLLWERLIGLDLSWNWQNEILRARLRAKLPDAIVAKLFPAYPENGPSMVGASDVWERLWAAIPPVYRHPKTASNAWVVSGEKSKSKSPLLANDPHLDLSVPSIWYLARVVTPDQQWVGATVPTVPFLVLGHNGRVAWGFTSAETDTTDIVHETIQTRAQDGKEIQVIVAPEGNALDDGVEIKTRTETIKVKGALEPETLIVRQGPRGPFISDIDPHLKALLKSGDKDQAFALEATFLDPTNTTIMGVYHLNLATSTAEAKRALESFSAPHQNAVFADVLGKIGFQSAGSVPLRFSGNGYDITEGKSDKGWFGRLPVGMLPSLDNPSSGQIVNANHRLQKNPPTYLWEEWALPYRADRIDALLAQSTQHDLDRFALIQNDSFSPMAMDLKPLLIKKTRAMLGDEGRGGLAPVLDLLDSWNGMAKRDRPEPLIFTAWYAELAQRLVGQVLGSELYQELHPLNPLIIKSALEGEGVACLISSPSKPERCDGVLVDSLQASLRSLEEALGKDRTKWRWGQRHHLNLGHGIFKHIPVIRDITRITTPTDGDDSSVNRGSPILAGDAPLFSQYKGAGFRGLYDLSQLHESRFMIATGQSGNILSRYYDDLSPLWADGLYVSLGGSEKAVQAKAHGKLTLLPQK